VAFAKVLVRMQKHQGAHNFLILLRLLAHRLHVIYRHVMSFTVTSCHLPSRHVMSFTVGSGLEDTKHFLGVCCRAVTLVLGFLRSVSGVLVPRTAPTLQMLE
jgi:hypothetical protein